MALTSTESRPIKVGAVDNCLLYVGFLASGRTTTSSIWRRIRTSTAASGAAEFPLNSLSYRCGRRRESWLVDGTVVEPEGYQLAASTIRIFLRENAS
jgi:hypothetical protein